jgi:hypothetical protein
MPNLLASTLATLLLTSAFAHAAEKAPSDDIAQCASATHMFATRKAEYDNNPTARLGQTLAFSEGKTGAALAGAIAGNAIERASNTPTSKLQHTLGQLETYFRMEDQYVSSYKKFVASFGAMRKAAEGVDKSDSIATSISRTVKEGILNGSTPEAIRAKIQTLLGSLSAAAKAKLGPLADTFMKDRFRFYELQHQRSTYLNSPEYQAGAGRFYRPMSTDHPDVFEEHSPASEKSIKKSALAKMGERSGLPRGTGALSGGVAGAIGAGVGKTVLISSKCGLGILSGEAGYLAPYIGVSLEGPCRLTSDGAVALANAKDEELQELCISVPDLADVMAKLDDRHKEEVAKNSRLEISELKCDGGAINTLSLKAKSRDDVERTYSFAVQPSKKFQGMVSDVFDSGNERNISYSVDYDSTTQKFGNVESPWFRGRNVARLKGFDSKDLQNYRSELDGVMPVDLIQRRAYFTGESLQYAEPLMNGAQDACAQFNTAATKEGGGATH